MTTPDTATAPAAAPKIPPKRPIPTAVFLKAAPAAPAAPVEAEAHAATTTKPQTAVERKAPSKPKTEAKKSMKAVKPPVSSKPPVAKTPVGPKKPADATTVRVVAKPPPKPPLQPKTIAVKKPAAKAAPKKAPTKKVAKAPSKPKTAPVKAKTAPVKKAPAKKAATENAMIPAPKQKEISSPHFSGPQIAAMDLTQALRDSSPCFVGTKKATRLEIRDCEPRAAALYCAECGLSFSKSYTRAEDVAKIVKLVKTVPHEFRPAKWNKMYDRLKEQAAAAK